MLNSCVVNLKVGPVSSYTLKKQVGCFNHRVCCNHVWVMCAGQPEAICGWSGPAWCRWWSRQLFAREAHRKILDLAIFSCQEGTSASNWELPLLWPFSLALLNVSLMCAHLRTYSAGFYYSSSVWEQDHTKVKLCLNFGWEWSGHGRTSRTGSGAYALLRLLPTCYHSNIIPAHHLGSSHLRLNLSGIHSMSFGH